MKFMFKHGLLSLLLLVSLTTTLIFLTERNILTVGFYENNGDPLSGISGQDIKIYDAVQKWVYISSVGYLLLRLAIISLIIYTALYLKNREKTFYSIFKIVVLADYLFIIPAAIKVFSFPYTYPNGTLLDWHRYYILSALNLFPDVPADWYYPLQTLNIFEIAYWFILAKGVSIVADIDFDQSLKVVVTSYLPALLIWVAAVTFFTLMMFPTTG